MFHVLYAWTLPWYCYLASLGILCTSSFLNVTICILLCLPAWSKRVHASRFGLGILPLGGIMSIVFRCTFTYNFSSAYFLPFRTFLRDWFFHGNGLTPVTMIQSLYDLRSTCAQACSKTQASVQTSLYWQVYLYCWFIEILLFLCPLVL